MVRTPFGRGRSGTSTLGWVLRGCAAGAAGTTALNAVTYLDMTIRGRGTSSTPEQTVERLAEKVHVPIPGDEEKRQNRVQGLGPLTGLVAANGPMTVLGITAPRTWSRTDWISDLVPHLAYGAVVKTTMDAFG